MKTNFLRIFTGWRLQVVATANDHEVVAKHYDDMAVQAQGKLKEQKELLEQYQNKSYLYGSEAQNLQSRTEALIRDYEQTVTATVREAAMHRQMAFRLQEKQGFFDTERENAVNGL
jgi:hypothetical protein